MKRLLLPIFLVLVLCTLSAQPNSAPLTNDDVISMVKANLPDDTIVLSVQKSPSHFDCSPRGLIALKSAGVSEKVMNAMLATQASITATPSLQAAASAPNIPSPITVKVFLANMAQQQSNGFLSLIDFEKTNGMSGSYEGTPIYTMNFNAVIRVNRDCYWKGVALGHDLSFNAVPPARSGGGLAGVMDMASMGLDGYTIQAGEVIKIVGDAVLQNTERGWIPQQLHFASIAAMSPAEIAAVQATRAQRQMADQAAQAERRAQKTANLRKVPGITELDLQTMFSLAAADPAPGEAPFHSTNPPLASVCPAGFTAEEHPPFAAFFKNDSGDQIGVYIGKAGLFYKPTLEKETAKTRSDYESSHAAAIQTDVVQTTLGHRPAHGWVGTCEQNGKVERDAYTLGVYGKYTVAVILFTEPDRVQAVWPSYRRICESIEGKFE